MDWRKGVFEHYDYEEGCPIDPITGLCQMKSVIPSNMPLLEQIEMAKKIPCPKCGALTTIVKQRGMSGYGMFQKECHQCNTAHMLLHPGYSDQDKWNWGNYPIPYANFEPNDSVTEQE